MGKDKTTRRDFLRLGTAATLAGTIVPHSAAHALTLTAQLETTQRHKLIPEHLPAKLAISCWQFTWVTCAIQGEPYNNLEEVMIGLKERGFNAVRLDAGYNWCFTSDEKPRGEIGFRAMIGGLNSRIRCKNGRGGGRYDVLQRVIHLMELAKKYDIYVILTSWGYMHSTDAVADKKLRDEVAAVPKPKRLMRMARHLDRLINILKEKDLHKNLAYVEPHNEVNYSSLVRGEEGKKLHEEAISYLRKKHPDILIVGDYNTPKIEEIADNTQIYDNHIYSGTPMYWENMWGKTVLDPSFDPLNPRKNKLFEYLVDKDYLPFDKFDVFHWEPGDAIDMRSYRSERKRYWLYYNLNIARFDRWMLQEFAKMESSLRERARNKYDENIAEAKRRGLPAVMSEGGLFFPPLDSRWEESESGLRYFDFITDLAIKDEFWGFLATTYNGPDNPIWWANPGWLMENNTRFLKGKLKE